MLFVTHCLDKPGALDNRLAHYDEHRAYLATAPVHVWSSPGRCSPTTARR